MYMDYYVYFATTIIIIYKLARKKKQLKVITCRYDIKVNCFWRLNILYSKKKVFISMFYRIIIRCVSSLYTIDRRQCTYLLFIYYDNYIICISIIYQALYIYLYILCNKTIWNIYGIVCICRCVICDKWWFCFLSVFSLLGY